MAFIPGCAQHSRAQQIAGSYCGQVFPGLKASDVIATINNDKYPHVLRISEKGDISVGFRGESSQFWFCTFTIKNGTVVGTKVHQAE
jgi:hypothetical protein